MGAPVRIGDVLAEKYKVTRILGEGGMGVVVAAQHRELDQLVALKFIHEEAASNEQITGRFLREARAAARLKGEHVAHVLDVGRLPTGAPYIVMEYLEGQDLGQLLERRGPLEVAEAVEYVLQACEAMAEAHAQGIIHRDLKPQNLFLTTRPDGRPLVKVLDFGISKTPFGQNPTSTLQAMGSPPYMAPEQIQSSRSVDTRADIWSLGVILYQLLSNTLPFAGETVPEVIFKVMSQPAPSLAVVRNRLPPGLVSAIGRCLEKDRTRRFANVAELAHELLPFAPERARAAIALIERVMTASVQPPAPSTDAELEAIMTADEPEHEISPSQPPPSAVQTTLAGAASSVSVSKTANPHRWRWFAISAAGTAGIVIIAVVALRSSPPPPAMPPPVAVSATTSVPVRPDAAQPDPASAGTFDAAVVAAPDVSLDAQPGKPPDAHTKPRAGLRRVVIDAAVDTAPEPLVLEPARTDEKPLVPAR